MTNNVQKDMNASCKLYQSQLVFQNLLFDLFITLDLFIIHTWEIGPKHILIQ